jgi:ATP-dependent DNA helicase RecG
MTEQDRLTSLVEEFAGLRSETSWVEFKENNYDPQRIGVLISAISNAARLDDKPCGFVVWGIEDGTHNIIGTSFQPGTFTAKGQPLELWLARSVSPSVNFRFKDIRHYKGRLVLLEIPAANQVPTKFNNIAYIRIGQATPKLVDHPEREAALLVKLVSFVWEQGVAIPFVLTKDVLELLDSDSYFELTGQPVPQSEDDIAVMLAHDKLISRDVGSRWNILNLGAILFAKDLATFDVVSRKAARVVQYEGLTRTGDTKERQGQKGYAAGFEGLARYVNQRLPRKQVIGRAFREEKPIYPEIAVRELLANALVHQDMAIRGAGPLIEIFSDRIEITNPGKPLVETNRFIDFPPRSRNESLAALMRRIGVCEEQGSGIDKVVIAVEQAHLPPPDFRADGDNTKVFLFGPKSFGEMSPEERVRGCYHHAVIRYIEGQGMTNASLRVRYGVAERNASQISRVIKQTTEAGLIRASEMWSSRSGHYLPFWA